MPPAETQVNRIGPITGEILYSSAKLRAVRVVVFTPSGAQIKPWPPTPEVDCAAWDFVGDMCIAGWAALRQAGAIQLVWTGEPRMGNA